MKTVNALSLRNRLGEILDSIEKTGEPVLVSKGRRIKAVLISPEDFQRRFLDHQATEARKRMLQTVKELRGSRIIEVDSVDLLRELRGYGR